MIMWTNRGFTVYDLRCMIYNWINHKAKIVARKYQRHGISGTSGYLLHS